MESQRSSSSDDDEDEIFGLDSLFSSTESERISSNCDDEIFGLDSLFSSKESGKRCSSSSSDGILNISSLFSSTESQKYSSLYHNYDDDDDDEIFNPSYLLNPEESDIVDTYERSKIERSSPTTDETPLPVDTPVVPPAVNITSDLVIRRNPIMKATRYFKTKEPGKLSFKKRDTLEILAEMEGGWWAAKHLRSQRVGLVPTNCIAPITPRRQKLSSVFLPEASTSLTASAPAPSHSPQLLSIQPVQQTSTLSHARPSHPRFQQNEQNTLVSSVISSQHHLTASQQSQHISLASANSNISHPLPAELNQPIAAATVNISTNSQQTNSQQISSQEVYQGVSRKLTKEHHNALKLIYTVNSEAKPIMHTIFDFGAPEKMQEETLQQYLLRFREMSNADYRRIFNRTQREQIESDPSCNSFDVSLWLPAIQQGCDRRALSEQDDWFTSGTLENHLKRVKDFRNTLFHSDLKLETSEYITKTEELRTLLSECLRLAGEKYRIDANLINKKTSELNKQITYIRSLTEINLKLIEKSDFFSGLQSLLLTKGHTDLLNYFGRLTHVNPSSTIAGQEIHLSVDSIFTPLKIVQAGRHEQHQIIKYSELLHYAHQKKQRDGSCVGQIILIEGVAGSGKTTLIKQLISSWASHQHSVREIDHYKFIIPIECRSRSFTSLSSVVGSLMPTAKESVQDETNMKECVLSLPSILILDGLDEINSVSRELFLEITELKNSDNLTIICTSRPEKTEDFYSMITDDINIMHLQIQGISEDCIESFISKYHEVLRADGISRQSTDDLLYYYRTRGIHLKHLFRSPLYASLMCILWAVAPNVMNKVTTEVELLIETSKLCVKKLLKRLKKHDDTQNLDVNTLRKKLEEFQEFLYAIALRCLRDDIVILDKDATEALEQKCRDLKLPKDEVLGAFLSCDNSWSSTGMIATLSFPHKSIQEFYSGLYIYKKVKSTVSLNSAENPFLALKNYIFSSRLPPDTQQRIMQIISDDLKSDKEELFSDSHRSKVITSVLSAALEKDLKTVKLESFQNMLSMLTGIFYYYEEDIRVSVAEELVALQRKSGIRNREQYIQILNSVKVNDTVVREIAKLPDILEGKVKIESHNVFAYASLFRVAKPEKVSITIHEDPSLVPRLEELISCLINNQCHVENLKLHYLFRNPGAAQKHQKLGKVLGQMMNSCSVDIYKGSAFRKFTLSKSLKKLFVSIRTDEDMERLHSNLQSHQLDYLRVCVAANFNPEALKPIPRSKYRPSLFLVDVTNELVENAALIAKRCQPVTGEKRFWNIYFPRGNLDHQHQLELIRIMGNMEIPVEYDVIFPSSIIPSHQQQQQLIREEAKGKLGCVDVDWGTLGIDDW